MLKLYTTIRFEQTIIATIMTRENHNFSSKMNPILWERKQVRGSKTQMKNTFFFLNKNKTGTMLEYPYHPRQREGTDYPSQLPN